MDYKNEFSDFGNVTYLDVAGQGPMPRSAAQAMRRAVEWKEQPQKMPEGVHFDLPDRVRALVARIIGAKASEVAITTGATTGLAAIACGIDWKADDEVLIAEREFPATFAAFAPLAERGQLRVRTVRAREPFLRAEDFVKSIGPRTRLVATSLVRFQDAARIDARPLADACHAARAWLALDVSQCAGAMPVDVAQLGADFVVSAGYKWLLSPNATGFFWLREDLIGQMRPAPFYWTALPHARAFESLDAPAPYRPEPGPRRWDAPETASLNLVAMEASLEFLLRASVESVWQHNRRLIGQILGQLPVDRCVLASPADPHFRGPFVCIAGRSPEKTRALYRNLRQAEMIVSLRENAIRISPHLYTSAGDIDRLAAALTI
ncbi:MAG TPA: aminotransferase class V-fold PLP-dependent enzyme [Patescibacteria group bacterium]|nr:aminotransferase class V-fold PLP-dependent enzyme [Patescibacteria group bacterium]